MTLEAELELRLHFPQSSGREDQLRRLVSCSGSFSSFFQVLVDGVKVNSMLHFCSLSCEPGKVQASGAGFGVSSIHGIHKRPRREVAGFVLHSPVGLHVLANRYNYPLSHSIQGGLLKDPLQIAKSMDTQVTYIKWQSICN